MVALSAREESKMLCSNCEAQLVPQAKLATRLRKVNDLLHKLGLEYHDTLSYSLNVVDRVLVENGFKETDSAPIITGVDGKLHCPVGCDKWLTVSWHRMASGRYELVAYVN